MRFALLGVDELTTTLVDAALAGGHELVWLGDVAGLDPSSRGWPSLVDSGAAWEDLLDAARCDGAFVGRGADDPAVRCRQVQELVKQGRPVLTSFPLFPSVLSYFEVDMARGETGAVVQHFNPFVHSPAIDLLRRLLQGADEWGAAEQLLCERQLIDRTRDRVTTAFATDVELLDDVAGGLDRVGAHAASGANSDDPRAYAGLSVQLSGTSPVPVRWSVVPPHAGASLTVALIFPEGRATVELDEAGLVARTSGISAGLLAASPQPLLSPAAAAVATFVAAIRAAPAAEDTHNRSTWQRALHAMELADSIEISLRRGRMIEVQGQQLTERLAFRGTMAAAGCGLLLVLPPLFLLIGWLAGLAGLDVGRFWPHALLGLLAAFLGLQLLSRLVYPPDPPRSAS